MPASSLILLKELDRNQHAHLTIQTHTRQSSSLSQDRNFTPPQQVISGPLMTKCTPLKKHFTSPPLSLALKPAFIIGINYHLHFLWPILSLFAIYVNLYFVSKLHQVV